MNEEALNQVEEENQENQEIEEAEIEKSKPKFLKKNLKMIRLKKRQKMNMLSIPKRFKKESIL